MFYLLLPQDEEGRGGPDPLQVPQAEPGQRVFPAARCTHTEIRAAGLYESVIACSDLVSTCVLSDLITKYRCEHPQDAFEIEALTSHLDAVWAVDDPL